MKIEYVVPYHRDGGVVCMYDEKVFNDIADANRFLKSTHETNHACVHNGWKTDVLDFGKVHIRLS